MAAISGAHMIVYSANADADRAFLRDVLGFPHVDVGGGWLIFALPSSEIAVHPAENGGQHEIYLMVNDVQNFVATMKSRGVNCTEPRDQGWGVLTSLSLPGGGALGVYEPRHARPTWAASPARKAAKPRTRKAARPRTRQSKRRVATKAVKPSRRGRRRTKR
jgi:catechol 2,3-dioxygenase-like lactoylglutathione lyase family enzyme